VTDPELDRQRRLLHEAFTAGWQAALAVKVTSPSVLAVIESCFELWLEEEVDERGVLGLPFRRRYDLPSPKRARVSLGRTASHERTPEAPPVTPVTPRRRQKRPAPAAVGPPAQRTSPENELHDDSPRDSGKVGAGS
jgi:hypothetical protein